MTLAKFLVTAVALLAVCSCQPEKVAPRPPKPIGQDTEERQDTKDPDGFKLMSFNVRYENSGDTGDQAWKRRKSAVCEMVNKQKPMVMGVQECLSGQKADILAGCKDYGAIGVGRDDGKNKGEMMAIFYRKNDVSIVEWGTFWLSLTPGVPSKDWNSACYRCATWARIKINATGKEVFYVDTHLDHQNGQAEQMAVLEEQMALLNKTKAPMFLSADFNVKEDEALFDHIQLTMANARKTAPITDKVKSYNSWGKAGSASNIDIIFYSKDSVKPLKFRTVNDSYDGLSLISDHYPIYAIFAL